MRISAWSSDVCSSDLLVDQRASGEVLGEDPSDPAAPLTWSQRVDIIAALPGMLADLQHHRIAMLTPRMPLRRAETPPRNAPCSCGSGRKFKKCCRSEARRAGKECVSTGRSRWVAAN